MFQRILVPLDGSTRAESALPVAVRLAQHAGGSVIFLYVAEPPVSSGKFSAPQAYPHVSTEKELAEASTYLQTLAQSVEGSGISTEVHTFAGGVASTILSATLSLHADLIVLSSHGYTGFKRWALGSVAHKLIPHSPVPVLVLRDGGPVPATTSGQPAHVVAPLDGSTLSESALEPAAQLASALAPAGQRTVQLLRVVDIPPSYGKFRGMVDAYYDSERRAEAKHEDELYLAAVAKRFSEGQLGQYQLAVTTTVVIDPDVARAIEQVADQAAEAHPSSSHLIVMATHGRGGVSHWMLGSVAERVLHASRLPLLVVHAANSSVL